MRRAETSFLSARRHHAGFTLVEVMMASIVLVVGFIGMMQTILAGAEMLATARRQTLAAQILSHEVEMLRLRPWADIAALPSGLPVSIPLTIDSQFSAAVTAVGLRASAPWQATDTLKLTRTCTVPDPDTDLREVNFTLTWTMQPSGGAAARTYTRKLSAYYGKYGLNLSYQRS